MENTMVETTSSVQTSTADGLDVGALAPREYVVRLRRLLPLAPALLYLLLLYIYPISKMLKLSLFDPTFTTEYYRHFVGSPIYANRLIFTFEIALAVTLICVVLGYPVAYLLTNVKSSVRNYLVLMVVIPFWVSILVRTYAWMVLLGRAGVINQLLLGLGIISEPVRLLHTTFAVLVGMVHVLLPFAILPMYSVMSSIDQELLKAAQNLGADSFQTFRRVFFPLSLPGVAGGGLLVFIIALGFYITPALLGGTSDVMIANLIDLQINALVNWGFGAAIAVILFGISLVIFYVYNRYLGLDQLLGGF
jgi:putative spermidine/putrescine transport system permease protein